ncbi:MULTISPECIES: DUF3310 domain-containing protein [Bacillati]|jgi:hypothetical protein|uniref:DUF3310 domain-containing protein n=4 Tax=root TaxID=1 RepID=A0A1W6JPA2_9CAUD|nr:MULTISPECIES: DUF3310 domain-containing protein [Staphylococcus]YP_010083005.1 nucleotide kinase [Staphylococcus phage IME1348_01]ASN70068.1 hypothetical protein 9S1_9 [uncultured Caudovirales phage]MBA9940922.1 DUF3310 domain-containing protein [Ralstonia insidiosa]QQV93199.1 putative nucleotide kinase [Staphylococcus virus vB_SepS_27]QQV93267.1 putative nucleotide kinase [Staphylococcus virus vB_SepS_48]ARM68036.1 hypothetical protein [Staphylococcus phage IME1348_01]
MSVGDLSIGEYIKFSDRDNKQRYGQVLNVYQDVFYLKYVAVVKVDGIGTIKIDDNYDFISVPRPTSKEVEKTLDDKVNHPSHYQGRKGIDVIEFLYQQLTFEEFKGFMKGNMIKYPVRAGRKDNELADIKKARDYADRLIEKLEVEGNGI